MADDRITAAAVRCEVRAAVPALIRSVLAAYAVQAAAAPGEDVKAAAAHHGACKAALQHAEMLTKLLRWAEADGAAAPVPPGAADARALLAEARAALGQTAVGQTAVGQEEGEEDDD